MKTYDEQVNKKFIVQDETMKKNKIISDLHKIQQ